MQDLLKRIWDNAAEIDTEAMRRIHGTCTACRTGIATERAVWVGDDGLAGEDIYRVCADCLLDTAKNTGAGYYRA